MRVLLCCAATLAAWWPLASPAQSLRDAFDAAWRRSPAGAAAPAREDEIAARRDSGRGWLRESPALTATYRTDQFDRNRGAREIELELGVPLATPAQRRANVAVGDAEAHTLDAQQAAARLKLAQEVRETYWGAQLAQMERDLAQRRLEEATQLADDVARRLAVGEAARVDANQARSARLQADAVLRTAQLEAQRALQAFFTLTGLARLPPAGEPSANAPARTDDHPLLAHARAVADVARARAQRASEIRRDTPEYSIALTRERGDVAELYGNTIRVGVRIPLGTDVRNRVLIAQTGAERTEAEAALQLEIERVRAEQALAHAELAAAYAARAAADERQRLARDTQQLIERAYRLGDRDLGTRLRADTERNEAELAAARSQAELGRAISRFNQSLGLLP